MHADVRLLLPCSVAVFAVLLVACGQVPEDFEPAVWQQPIVGGEEVSVGNNNASPYPFTVAMLTGSEGDYRKRGCGGSLIHERWVVTAAHCADTELSAVALGRAELFGEGGEVRRVVRTIEHAGFNGYATNGYDIMLLELEEPSHYKPVQLTRQWAPSASVAMAAGWGFLSEWGPSPGTMHQVELPVVDVQECERTTGMGEAGVCAGYPEGQKDTCSGDSGGPLFASGDFDYPREDGQYYLLGITSYGRGCARPENYGVYTRVSEYVDWILDNTGEDIPIYDNVFADDPDDNEDEDGDSEEHYLLSQQVDLSSDDDTFTTGDTMFLGAIIPGLQEGDLSEARYHVLVGSQRVSGELRFDDEGRLTASLQLDGLEPGEGRVAFRIEDQAQRKYKATRPFHLLP